MPGTQTGGQRRAVDVLRTGRPLARGGQLTAAGQAFAARIAPALRRRAAAGR
jgi:hypothetical protein